jgi:hypothetical protein
MVARASRPRPRPSGGKPGRLINWQWLQAVNTEVRRLYPSVPRLEAALDPTLTMHCPAAAPSFARPAIGATTARPAPTRRCCSTPSMRIATANPTATTSRTTITHDRKARSRSEAAAQTGGRRARGRNRRDQSANRRPRKQSSKPTSARSCVAICATPRARCSASHCRRQQLNSASRPSCCGRFLATPLSIISHAPSRSAGRCAAVPAKRRSWQSTITATSHWKALRRAAPLTRRSGMQGLRRNHGYY